MNFENKRRNEKEPAQVFYGEDNGSITERYSRKADPDEPRSLPRNDGDPRDISEIIKD